MSLEDQFILRVPERDATKIRKILKKKLEKQKLLLNLELDVENRKGAMRVHKRRLEGTLFDLPTPVEAYKTVDNANIFKTANVSQILICSRTNDLNKAVVEDDNGDTVDDYNNKKYVYKHGLTPPMKNVKKRRFRKTLKNTKLAIDAEDIEKEVLLLLRADNEAVTTRFELIIEKEPNNNTLSELNEMALFGDVLSSSDSDDSGASGLNDLIDFTN